MKLNILQEIFLLALLECKIYSREHDKFKSCRVYLSDCGEVPLSTVPLAYLQHHYGNCKFVLGNLVICDLKRLDNGSDPDLSFLDAIEEVSGYVYLSRNEVRRIPLKSLKVIRGEPAYQFGDEYGSLIVTRNGRNLTYGLETIDLRSIVVSEIDEVWSVEMTEHFARWIEAATLPDRRTDKTTQARAV